MKAVGFTKSLPIQDENSFIDFETNKPVPEKQDLLVKIEAIAVNPVDYKTRKSSAKEELDKPKIIGWDAVGVVEETGNNVSFFKKGDHVFYSGDMNRPGCNAEYHIVNEQLVGKKPEKLKPEEAAAIPLTGLTAWESLFDRLKLAQDEEDGKSILIIGGAGGVGSMAIQLAKKLTKLKVITTASREESQKWCYDLGADLVINYKEEKIPEAIRKNGLQYTDYILNVNNTAQYWEDMAEIIKPQGSICCIVETPDPLNLNVLKSKSVTFHWELMFTRALFQTEDMVAQHHILNELSSLLDSGEIKTTLGIVLTGLSSENLKEAHQLQESGKAIGKTVIKF